MNYSLRLKEELIAGAPRKPCCKMAYLQGLFVNAARTKGGHVVLTLSALAAKKEAARVYRDMYKKQALVNDRTLLFSSEALLTDLTDPPSFDCPVCSTSFLRGAFISSGTATDPEKGYHFEFRVFEDEKRALLVKLLSKNAWFPKERTLKEGFGLYFKSSATIEEILTALGANNALFTLMNARIARSIRNEENRATNCVAKNIGKSVDASRRVLNAIAALRCAARFDALPEELRETALLREANPDVSLADLAKLHNPPLTKSGLNHRLQKIIATAETEKN